MLKNRKLFLYGMLLVLLSLVIVGCGPEPKHSAVNIPEAPVYQGGIVEIGNHIYIPANLEGLPEVNIETLYTLVRQWEDAHPDRLVIDCQFLWMQNSEISNAADYSFGVSLIAVPFEDLKEKLGLYSL